MMSLPPFLLNQLRQRLGQGQFQGQQGMPPQQGMPQIPPQGMPPQPGQFPPGMPPQPGTFNPMPFEGGQIPGLGGLKPQGPPQLGLGFGRGHFGPPQGMPMRGAKRY